MWANQQTSRKNAKSLYATLFFFMYEHSVNQWEGTDRQTKKKRQKNDDMRVCDCDGWRLRKYQIKNILWYLQSSKNWIDTRGHGYTHSTHLFYSST